MRDLNSWTMRILVLAMTGFCVWTISGSRETEAQGRPNGVAVVDVTKVLTQSTVGKAAYDRLKTLQDSKVAKSKAMDDEIKQLDEQIKAGR